MTDSRQCALDAFKRKAGVVTKVDEELVDSDNSAPSDDTIGTPEKFARGIPDDSGCVDVERARGQTYLVDTPVFQVMLPDGSVWVKRVRGLKLPTDVFRISEKLDYVEKLHPDHFIFILKSSLFPTHMYWKPDYSSFIRVAVIRRDAMPEDTAPVDLNTTYGSHDGEPGTLEKLRDFINSNSLENGSNTPDFLLAGFLVKLLRAFDIAVKQRDEWYGRHGKSGQPDSVPEIKGRLSEEDLEQFTQMISQFAGNWEVRVMTTLVTEVRASWAENAELRTELANARVDDAMYELSVATLRNALQSMECDCASPTRKDICPKCRILNFLKRVP